MIEYPYMYPYIDWGFKNFLYFSYRMSIQHQLNVVPNVQHLAPPISLRLNSVLAFTNPTH